MGLNGYRTYRDTYQDDGEEILKILGETFRPDFHNRHTIQIWDVSNSSTVYIDKWIGTTLKNRSLHEITIPNNSSIHKIITFANNYVLEDEDTYTDNNKPYILIGAGETAYFYCTAILVDGNLIFEMRTGSQDDRNTI